MSLGEPDGSTRTIRRYLSAHETAPTATAPTGTVDDPDYQPMAPDTYNSIPFQAALLLVLEGRDEPNGYTERILRHHRRLMKARRLGHLG